MKGYTRKAHSTDIRRQGDRKERNGNPREKANRHSKK